MSSLTHPRGAATLVLVVLLVLGTLVGIGLWRQRVPLPTVTLAQPVTAIGRHAALPTQVRAQGGHLSALRIRLVQEGRAIPVLDAELGSVASEVVDSTFAFDTDAEGLHEGEALLEIFALDDYWRPRIATDRPALRIPVLIDHTPPRLRVEAVTRYPRPGGSAVAVLSSEDEAEVEVHAGDWSFRARPLGPAGRFVSFFGLPIDHPATDPPFAVAIDAAGNRARTDLPVVLVEPKIPTGEVELGGDWLRRKLPELLPGREARIAEDPAAAFLMVSRDQRAAAAERLRELADASADSILWSGAFGQMPNSRVMSRFGVRRTYRFDGKALDEQVHQGFDLASVRHAPVPAAADGRVVYAGPLTLYGNVVVLDHGLGLLTLYGHCSQLEVGAGDFVRRGQTIAETGATGLAGGDHLHFEVVIGGLPVDPLQWWDAGWIRDHVLAVLREGGVPVGG